MGRVETVEARTEAGRHAAISASTAATKLTFEGCLVCTVTGETTRKKKKKHWRTAEPPENAYLYLGDASRTVHSVG